MNVFIGHVEITWFNNNTSVLNCVEIGSGNVGGAEQRTAVRVISAVLTANSSLSSSYAVFTNFHVIWMQIIV